jgi:hypothetical protein
VGLNIFVLAVLDNVIVGPSVDIVWLPERIAVGVSVENKVSPVKTTLAPNTEFAVLPDKFKSVASKSTFE